MLATVNENKIGAVMLQRYRLQKKLVFPQRQTAQLANELLYKHRNLESVCLDSNLAVLKYSISPKNSDLDDACLDEEMVNYAQVITAVF